MTWCDAPWVDVVTKWSRTKPESRRPCFSNRAIWLVHNGHVVSILLSHLSVPQLSYLNYWRWITIAMMEVAATWIQRQNEKVSFSFWFFWGQYWTNDTNTNYQPHKWNTVRTSACLSTCGKQRSSREVLSFFIVWPSILLKTKSHNSLLTYLEHSSAWKK